MAGKLSSRSKNGESRLARKPLLAILVAGMAAPVMRLLILPLAPPPEPAIHDEFSYLLAGETFASGRLTNPTHPMWEHFETFHLSHKPTYMSMYFPVQGMILAAGKVAFGHPGTGLLQRGRDVRGALLDAAGVVASRMGVPRGHAGGIACRGLQLLDECLLGRRGIGHRRSFGIRRAAASDAPSSRAYLSSHGARPRNSCQQPALRRRATRWRCPLPALLIWAMGRKRPPLHVVLTRVAIPLSALLLITAAAMGYYNWRVFGNPLTLPYQINRATSAVASVFVSGSRQGRNRFTTTK